MPRPNEHSAVTQVRLKPSTVEDIDAWRRLQNDIPNRSEAIRRLIQLGLDAAKLASGRKPE